ncbi:MAG: hypothetical protein KDD94_10715 [Calditrichaeota bacterium]|nr:hypothetical protein [Calditrichota bacterium]
MKTLIAILIIIVLSACGDSFSNENKHDIKKVTINRDTDGGSGGTGIYLPPKRPKSTK